MMDHTAHGGEPMKLRHPFDQMMFQDGVITMWSSESPSARLEVPAGVASFSGVVLDIPGGVAVLHPAGSGGGPKSAPAEETALCGFCGAPIDPATVKAKKAADA